MSTSRTINSTNHPDFSVPSFGLIDFGIPSDGPFSPGYKMVAFEPGKILQAQELNEIQFRMSVHQSLTSMMYTHWINELILSSNSETTGPGWDGATPLSPKYLSYVPANQTISFSRSGWYLCKANSNSLFFWLYFSSAVQPVAINFSNIENDSYIGFTLNTTATTSSGVEYTGQLVNCNTIDPLGPLATLTKHSLNVKNSSVCGSSRYFLEIRGITHSSVPINNEFVGIAQKRTNGQTTSFYYLNNIKVQETEV